MSTRSTDNAFPVHSTDFFEGSPIGTTTHHGLTKREYFAAIALQGLLASTHWSFGLKSFRVSPLHQMQTLQQFPFSKRMP
ncbi:hypothetical protein C7B65_26485 [Phormidesmis priestleyi ULC007]|uniref:Uncharacterized protein n=1 Tax=Phormidesmis priestleyi ULC007 TaxID=1920490 RepID=A0A2T1D1M2_9CYAN|nr:hypothetical protein [Phormidesmis priestleyi]PSB14398.1 hypothetical protein C7B65_26485 [Phormidesmis priestleyi ULC007]PZO49388.1 MAG: hypothetical protein DCF14_14690 [Phormidesmis priestleyi]